MPVEETGWGWDGRGQEGTLETLSEGTEEFIKVSVFAFQKSGDSLGNISLQLKLTIFSSISWQTSPGLPPVSQPPQCWDPKHTTLKPRSFYMSSEDQTWEFQACKASSLPDEPFLHLRAVFQETIQHQTCLRLKGPLRHMASSLLSRITGPLRDQQAKENKCSCFP